MLYQQFQCRLSAVTVWPKVVKVEEESVEAGRVMSTVNVPIISSPVESRTALGSDEQGPYLRQLLLLVFCATHSYSGIT